MHTTLLAVFGFVGKIFCNYKYHRFGRIWICWKDDVITTFCKSAQIIIGSVTSVRGEQIVCSCVYASNFQMEQSVLRDERKTIYNFYVFGNVPNIIMADFKETLACSCEICKMKRELRNYVVKQKNNGPEGNYMNKNPKGSKQVEKAMTSEGKYKSR